MGKCGPRRSTVAGLHICIVFLVDLTSSGWTLCGAFAHWINEFIYPFVCAKRKSVEFPPGNVLSNKCSDIVEFSLSSMHGLLRRRQKVFFTFSYPKRLTHRLALNHSSICDDTQSESAEFESLLLFTALAVATRTRQNRVRECNPCII